MIAMRSPIWTPAAINPLAVARTSSSTSRAVTGCQPSPSGRDMVMRSGSNKARSAIKFVRFPAAAAGTSGGIEISFIAQR